MLWFGLHLPFLALEVFEQPEIKDQGLPAVITEAQEVFCVNEPARAAGIRSGASLATARSLLPELIHRTRSREAESQRMERLVMTAYEFTPYVSVADFDALLLEMEGSLKLFGGVNQVRSRLRSRFRRIGHRVVIGIAHTPRASLAFAKSGDEATWPDFPERSEIEHIGLQQLDATSLDYLELEPKIRERFANMGMRKVGDIVHVPRHELRKRFGEKVTDYVAQLTGERVDPWEAEQPPEMFSERLHLIDPVRGKDEVLEPMEHLAKVLSKWLGKLNLGARRLRWGVYAFEGDGATFEVGFEQPRHEVSDIMAITHLRMETVDLPSEAMTVTLDALRTGHLGLKWIERDVLGQPLTQSTPSHELLDRLTARLGEGALQRFCILDDHRPEFAWMPTDESDAYDATANVPELGRRPLWLLEPPVRVRAGHLHIVSGPERIQCGWWDHEQHRDYFVARDRDETWCWCFRDTQGWFVHGYFA